MSESDKTKDEIFRDRLAQIEYEYETKLNTLKKEILIAINSETEEISKFMLNLVRGHIDKALYEFNAPKEKFRMTVLTLINFTDKERDTIDLLFNNYDIKNISKIFNVSENTIRGRFEKILAKILDNCDLNKLILTIYPELEFKETIKTLKKIFNIEFDEHNKQHLELLEKAVIAVKNRSIKSRLKSKRKYFAKKG